MDVNTLQFPMPPIPPRPVTPSGAAQNKLRKKRADGYESDGGYVSEGAVRRKRKDSASTKKKEKEKDLAGAAELGKKEKKEARSRAKSEKLQEKEEERKRKKSLTASKNSAPSGKDSGYETDFTPKKSKSKSKPGTGGDVGYETDDGGLSKSKSRRFFRLGGAKSDVGEKEAKEEKVGEVPVLPVLPIAQRFATTLGNVGVSTGGSVNGGGNSVGTEMPLPPALPNIAISTSPLGLGENEKGRDRGSQGSVKSTASSSGSSPSRKSPTSSSSPSGRHRWGVQFSPDLGASGNGHHGSGSHSTLTAASTPLSVSPSSTSKFPMISYPLTRSPSETQAQGATPGNQNHTLDPLPPSRYHEPTSLAPTLSPSVGSPFALITPLSTRRPKHPNLIPDTKPNPPKINTHLTVEVGVANAGGSARLGPIPFAANIIPSSEYIVPSPQSATAPLSFPSRNPSPFASRSHSRDPSPMPGPNVLAYYDIPPATPPPAGPLPLPPMRKAPSMSALRGAPSGGARVGLGAGMEQHEQHVHQQQGQQQEQGLFGQPIPHVQRGREAPFPAKPVLPVLPVNGGSSSSSCEGTVPGLEERVRERRYRDLYAVASPAGGWVSQEKERETRQVADDNEGNGEGGYWDEYGLLGDEEDGEEEEEGIRHVLDRFEGEMRGVGGGRALERSLSFEALNKSDPPRTNNNFVPSDSYAYTTTRRKDDSEDDDRSVYTDESQTAVRETKYVLERDDEEVWGGMEKNSRWSGSIYSRTSVLDVETSGEARERFVRRVEAMLDETGRQKEKGVGRGVGRGMDVPPVPKLPEGLRARPGTATGVGARPKWRF